MIYLFAGYIAIGVIYALFSIFVYVDAINKEEAKRAAQTFFMSGLWPVLAFAALAELWRTAFIDSIDE